MAEATKLAVGLACGRDGCPCGRAAQNGTGKTHCPAHGDANPSLSVRVIDGKHLFHCQAGCSQDEVISALREHGLWTDTRPAEFTPYSPFG